MTALYKYLIAYIAPNDRVNKEIVFGENQKEAIETFHKINPCSEIIAITVLED